METSGAQSPRRILFVGDSLTYVNDLDEHVRVLAEQSQPEAKFVVDRSVQGGAPLDELWNNTDAPRRLKTGGFDVAWPRLVH